MIIYSDLISGDEIVSDAYDIKVVDDTVYEVDCKMITLKQGVDVDIGANASAEEPAEDELEEGSVTVNNIVSSFRLSETSFDKKAYLTHLKGYMKAVKAKLQASGADEEKVSSFEKKAAAYAKKIVSGFKDYEFYTGESMDIDGMVVLLNYREDGVTPYLTIWKDGLKETKV